MKTRLAVVIRRIRAAAPTQWWPIVGLFTIISLFVVLRDSPGTLVVDNRFDLIADPGTRIVKSFQLWDWSRGLGDIREDVWPLPTVVSELLHLARVPLWLSVRLWHAVCLVIAATGVVAVLRLFRPRIGSEHVLAGMLAAFGPFSLTFLVPSNLYLMFALGPWLLVLVVRGITEPDGWRWAAWFALVIGAAGNPDLPGLVYAIVLFVPAILYLIDEDRSTTVRRTIRWIAMAGALTVAVSALMLTKTALAQRRLSSRVAETESVSVSALTSSWSESVRGLGNWLSYFRAGGTLVKPQGVIYFDQEVVVAATFVVPLVALLVFWRSRWRPRLLFVTMMTVSLVIMVGSFRSDDSPIAWLIGEMMGSSGALAGFRNPYKAAGGLVVGGSILAAMGYAGLLRRARQGSATWPTAALHVGALAVVMAVSAPAWTGNLYHPDRSAEEIPEYWYAATDFLDQIPEPGRVLVVPAVSQAPYRWGTVGDDLFDGLLDRPHAVATGVTLSAPLGADALESLTLAAQDPASRPGEFAAIARRLGITEVVIRNDLDWQDASVARPARFDPLRDDPSVELVAAFGDAGDNVVAPDDVSATAARELELPPVEVYRIVDSSGVGRVTTAAAPLIVSGDARSWPALLSSGLLPDGVPTLASGAGTVAQLTDAFDRGGEVVITDTPRRRVRALVSFEPELSHTLAAGEDLDRSARPLFAAPGSEAVAWFADAEEIVGSVTREVGSTARRPALAFDGDPDTAWSVPQALAGGGARLRVRFRETQTIDDVTIHALMRGSVSTVRSGWVSLSDGTVRSFSVDADGVAQLDLGGAETDSFDVLLRGFDPQAGRVGLTDVRIGALDLREFIQSPDDLLRRSELAEVVEQSPVSFSFTRVRAPTWFETADDYSVRSDEERAIRRRFDVPAARDYELIGTATVTSLSGSERVTEIVDAAADGGCLDLGIRLRGDDGASLTALVRPTGEAFDIRSGRPFVVEGCEMIELDSGWHLLEGGDSGLLDRLSLLDVTRTVAGPAPTSALDVEKVSPGKVVVGGPFDGSFVTLQTSYDPSWELVTADGERRASSPIDGVNGWYLPDGADGRIQFVRSGERLVSGAALVSMFAVLLCVWLIVRRRIARPADRSTSDRATSGRDEPGELTAASGARPGDGGLDVDDLDFDDLDFDDFDFDGLDASDGVDESNPFSLHWFQPGDTIGPEWFVSDPAGVTDVADSTDAAVPTDSAADASAAAPSRRAVAVAVTISVVGAVLLVGWPGLVVAVGSSIAIVGRRRARLSVGRSIDAVPAALLFLAAVATLVQQPLGSGGPELRFAGDRRWAHELALMAFAVVAALVPLRWLSERLDDGDEALDAGTPGPEIDERLQSARDEAAAAS